jgi:hypothetical protein
MMSIEPRKLLLVLLCAAPLALAACQNHEHPGEGASGGDSSHEHPGEGGDASMGGSTSEHAGEDASSDEHPGE